MSDFTLPQRHNRIVSMVAGVGHSISQILESLQAGLDARDAYERFSLMTDGELARRGVTREEIPGIVMRRYLSGKH